MAMSTEMEQIRLCYEQGMTPEEIAVDRELTVEATKVALASCCPQYKKDCGVEPQNESKLNFNDEQLENVNRVIYETAIGAENEAVRLKAAMYIRDDKKGRLDVVKSVGGFQFNILQIDARMKKAMSALDQGTQKLLSNVS